MPPPRGAHAGRHAQVTRHRSRPGGERRHRYGPEADRGAGERRNTAHRFEAIGLSRRIDEPAPVVLYARILTRHGDTVRGQSPVHFHRLAGRPQVFTRLLRLRQPFHDRIVGPALIARRLAAHPLVGARGWSGRTGRGGLGPVRFRGTGGRRVSLGSQCPRFARGGARKLAGGRGGGL